MRKAAEDLPKRLNENSESFLQGVFTEGPLCDPHRGSFRAWPQIFSTLVLRIQAVVITCHRLHTLQIYVSQFWKLEVPDQSDITVAHILVRAHFLVHSWYLSLCRHGRRGKREGGRGRSVRTALTPFMGAPLLHDLSTSQRPQLLLPLSLGVRTST